MYLSALGGGKDMGTRESGVEILGDGWALS